MSSAHSSTLKKFSELTKIPGIGPAMTRDLNHLGIFAIADLKKQNPELLYQQLNDQTGQIQDRCVLYVFREAVYYAQGGRDPQKLKWWHWKD